MRIAILIILLSLMAAYAKAQDTEGFLYKAIVTWDRPTARENGDPLPVNEITHYTIMVSGRGLDANPMVFQVDDNNAQEARVEFNLAVTREDALEVGYMPTEFVMTATATGINEAGETVLLDSKPSDIVPMDVPIPQEVKDLFISSPPVKVINIRVVADVTINVLSAQPTESK